MSPATRKKPSRRKRKPLTADQLHKREKKAYEKGFHVLFGKLGFTRIATDGIEIKFRGRTGEIDDIFIFKNILIVTEYTIGKTDSTHLLRKKVLYDHILNNPSEFLEFAKSTYKQLQNVLDPLYPDNAFNIRILYASKQEPSTELIESCPNIRFIFGATTKYFQALIKTIERSARIEFFKFIGLQYDDVGEEALTHQRKPISYDGFLLPEGNSSYPKDYKIVSFYADPETLISKSYVLRRDGWRDESHLYQRILIPKKIRQMRRYLTDEKRVFVNNVIVTLPPDTKLNAADQRGRNLQESELGRVKPVSVQIPPGFDTIGIVDGQHRVFCYHEGTDRGEREICQLRKRQNLLATGIVYPASVNDIERRSFEAKLFLEINDNQARARSALKQDIEIIIRPYSGIAIAKRVVQEMGRRGPYKGMLQTNYFDPPSKIKTSSIVSYGLRPIVKTEGDDSLFSIWDHKDKNKLREEKGVDQTRLLEEYIDFCTKKLNEFMVEVKQAHGSNLWDIDAQPRSALLSPTAINGQIICLRKIIASGQELSGSAHKKKLKNVAKFKFAAYKSSQWQRLGSDLFTRHYETK